MGGGVSEMLNYFTQGPFLLETSGWPLSDLLGVSKEGPSNKRATWERGWKLIQHSLCYPDIRVSSLYSRKEFINQHYFILFVDLAEFEPWAL